MVRVIRYRTSTKAINGSSRARMVIAVDAPVSNMAKTGLPIPPVVAVEKLMAKMSVDINHWDLIEANEAFSVQALVDGRELKWDWDRVNVNGGAVALGHPIGASGARVLVTLLYAMKNRGKTKGMTTLCLGGGNGVGMAVELV